MGDSSDSAGLPCSRLLLRRPAFQPLSAEKVPARPIWISRPVSRYAARMSERVIVVLGCAVGPDGQPSSALSRRISAARAVWAANPRAKLLASGGRRWFGRAEASVILEQMRARGVPAGALLAELSSLTTRENAEYSRDLLSRRYPAGLPRVVLVSCDWHLPRALVNFRRAGLECVPFAAPSPGGSVEGGWRKLKERLRRLGDTLGR